jgi:catalase
MAEPRRRPSTTTDAGVPAVSDEHSLTTGRRADRERVPERIVHAKGGLGRSLSFLDQRLAS